MIRISVVIPTCNRPTELRACLDGFMAQSAPRESFEVIVIDDGSRENMEPIALQFDASMNIVYRRIENSGPSVARNLAIDQAAAPLLLLYDDDLSPAPDMIESCLQFHESWPEEKHAALLRFCPSPAIGNDLLVRWAFPRMYPFPSAAGVYDWRAFWSGTLTCKKTIFRFGRFSKEFRSLEDAELALRLTRRLDLRIHFERRTMGLYTRPLTFTQCLARSYTRGYYDYRLDRKYPGAFGSQISSEADRFLVPEAELKGLIAGAQALLETRPELGSPGFRMLSALWTRSDVHAHADGWRAACDGNRPDPPGTAGAFLKY
jgi:glycosyltransferase involved in cell wall biosynthesis